MDTIRTLALYQPFATLMLHGKIETRWIRNNRKPPFPLGKYLIYAAKRKYSLEALMSICGDQYKRVVDIICKDDTSDLTGVAICTCDLVGIIDPLPKLYEEKAFVKVHTPDSCFRMVGLHFLNVQHVEPFKVRGKQGIGFLSDVETAKIKPIYDLQVSR
jgi:hypothetical protein